MTDLGAPTSPVPVDESWQIADLGTPWLVVAGVGAFTLLLSVLCYGRCCGQDVSEEHYTEGGATTKIRHESGI